MATSTTKTNKPFNPRGNDQSPKGYNRAKLYSGKALDFDGVNDYVTTPNISVQSTNVWTYSSNIVFNSSTSYWFDARQSDIGYAVYFDSSIKKLILYTTSGIIFNFEFEFSKWYNIALTSNSTTASLYVNGELVDSQNYTNSFSVTGDFYIGARHSLVSYFNGSMSGFKAFNTALTAAQVADLYNNPEKVVPTGVDNTALKLWLPMMEGAGTTAYDGSGNGNHGTISGATYVNGVGAPVSQSAVMDWNKGTNLITQTEAIASNWSLSGGTWSSGQDDPFGGTNAAKITSTNSDPYAYRNANNGIGGTQYTAKCWVKGDAGREARLWIIRDNLDFPYEDFTLTGDWQEIETTKTFGTTPVSFVTFRLDIPNDTPGAGDVAYIFAPRLVAGNNADVYVPTLSTAQTTPVLLPQGLTTGRDITGVNLFENVRKQGALNLDGNSWAEVHDNASLDFGTGSFTLEAWVKADFLFQGSSVNTILSLGGDMTDANTSALVSTSSNFAFWVGGISRSTPNYVPKSWNHIVGVRSGSSIIFYFNGSQVSTGTNSSLTTNSEVKQIGRDTNTIRQYNDQIAQPRIYNRALTAEEVQRSYDSGKNIYTNS
jgi:hypothetical protein